jgi:hypothetical protein
MGVIAKRPIANAAWLAEPPEGAYSRPYWERLQQLAGDPWAKHQGAVFVEKLDLFVGEQVRRGGLNHATIIGRFRRAVVTHYAPLYAVS